MTDSNDRGCQCEWLVDYRCGEVFYKEHNGRRYCVLHYPSTEKKEDFEGALQAKQAGRLGFAEIAITRGRHSRLV